MELKLQRPLVIFDLETTGLDLVRDRIIQIAYIKICPDGSETRCNYLVNPDKGFMGEFARDRILSLARFLKGEPTSEDVEFWIDQDIEAFLEELSEPYIKNQLRLLYSTSLDEENTD